MRNRIVWGMAALVIGFVASGSSQAQQIQNQITNGNFETGAVAPWTTFGTVSMEVVTTCAGATVPEGPVEGRYCLHVTVPAAGANYWDIGLSPRGMVFQKGKKYTLSAFLKCKKGTLQLDFKPQIGGDPWTGYGQKTVTMTDKWAEYTTTTPVFAADVTPPNIAFHTGFAAAEFWVDDVKWYEGDYVPTVVKISGSAWDLNPKDGATDVPRDTNLAWTAGPFAKTHDVYFGPVSNDVDTATTAKPLGVLVGQGQLETLFDLPGLLDYGKTYFWRVDEVNAPPSTTVFKGNVWKFTVEPYAYPITSVTATASSSDRSTMPPANTVNGSGLTNDLHSTSNDAMWLSSMTGPQPTWIQYQFDRIYKLYELWVWNHNTDFEPILGYGFKDVTVEYSTDGTNWTLLKDAQFAQATALAGYAHNTTINLGGVMARYIRLTAKSNWSMVGLKQYGLSEVRFFYIPAEARAPQPANNADGVSVSAGLDWRPGRDVASHKVIFGIDRAAVTNGTATAKTVTDHGFAPGSLDFGTVYYWKVDEVNAVTYPGSVWSFTTQQYAVVDDFEAYTDKEGGRIFDIWIDGWTNGTGSLVGNLVAPFAEQTIVHGGKQAMPFEYNNVKTPYYSEAQRTFDTPQDWTASGANTLALWFRGYPVGFVDKGGNAFSVSSTGADIWGNADQFRFACRQLSGNGSITARVDSLTRSDAWSKAGVMIRETLDPASRHAMVVMTPDNGGSFQYRTNTGGTSASSDTAGLKIPYWVRITRTGNSFKAERSPDGKTWTQVGSDLTLAMSSSVFIGLVVTSHNTAAYSTAEFSNVSTTGTGAWQSSSIGVTQWSNSPAPLYVTVEDKAGKTKTVLHPDAAATNVSAWTQWRIALSDLAGVNLAAVKKLSVGVGDKANPKAGAAGMLYLDDIQFGKPIVPIGLVANYMLENDVKDVTGNGHDGTLLGTLTYVAGAPGKGQGLLFPGTPGNAVSLGTFDPSEKTSMLSISLWAKWNGLSTYYQGLIAKRNSWAADQMMWQIEASQTTGSLSFSRNGSGSAGAAALKVGEWTHLAVTFDKTTARFYVNGVQTGSGAFSFGSNRDAALLIGSDNAGGGNPFNGTLDEVRLYDVALTDAEILTLAGK